MLASAVRLALPQTLDARRTLPLDNRVSALNVAGLGARCELQVRCRGCCGDSHPRGRRCRVTCPASHVRGKAAVLARPAATQRLSSARCAVATAQGFAKRLACPCSTGHLRSSDCSGYGDVTPAVYGALALALASPRLWDLCSLRDVPAPADEGACGRRARETPAAAYACQEKRAGRAVGTRVAARRQRVKRRVISHGVAA